MKNGSHQKLGAQVMSFHHPSGRPPCQQDGVLVLYKPRGMSSAAAIACIKRGFGQKKIGHAGTLDPMAEGVLLVLLGQATKLSGYLMDAGRKIYSGSILLGVETDTWDMEGNVLHDTPHDQIKSQVTPEAVHAAMKDLVGTYEQQVPAYSAAKHQGKPLYALAREGRETPVKTKTVTIFSGQIESVDLPHVCFRVECSSGTYIRSLAHSLGKRLGCGAALEKLIREYSYPFGLEKAVRFEQLQENPALFEHCVCSIADALPEWPRLVISDSDKARVRNGMPLSFAGSLPGTPFAKGLRAILLQDGSIPVALAETNLVNGEEVWSIMRGLWNKQR